MVILAEEDDKYEFVMNAATRIFNFTQIVEWLKHHALKSPL